MNKNKGLVNLVVGFVKLTGLLPAIVFLKPRVVRQTRRLPAPCILVSNHKSLMDFVLYLYVFPLRTIRFLMAEVLFNKGKLFASFLYLLGGIKVERDAFDFDFVSHTIEALDAGDTVGIFPEGRLPVNGKGWPFTVSTAYISMHADAPIVPVYTDGNYGLFKRVGVVVGEPFTLADYRKEGLGEQEQLAHLTQVLEQKVFALKDQLEKKDGDR